MHVKLKIELRSLKEEGEVIYRDIFEIIITLSVVYNKMTNFIEEKENRTLSQLVKGETSKSEETVINSLSNIHARRGVLR